MKSVLLLIACLSSTVFAKVEVKQSWARETPPTASMTAVYFDLKNQGSKLDELLTVKSSVGKAEIHTMKMDDGMAMMEELPSLPVPANSLVELRPGGIHLMLKDLNMPLKAGQKIKLTLTFKSGQLLNITVPIKAL